MPHVWGPDGGTHDRGPARSRYRTKTQTQTYEDIEFGFCPRQVCDMLFEFGGSVPNYRLESAVIDNVSNAGTSILPGANTNTAIAFFIVPRDGILSAVQLVAEDTLAASDTNFQTFALTNLLGAGAGAIAMLAATAPNTTQATGGAAVTGGVPRSMTLSATAASLRVNAGDVLKFTATATQSPTVSDAPRVTLTIQTLPFELTPISARTAAGVGISQVANTANGEANMILSSTSEVSTAGFSFGDQLIIPATRSPLFEALVKFTSGGTSSGLATSERLVAGLCSAYNATLDSIAEMAWFRVEVSGLRWDMEADDATTDTDDQSSGISAVASTYNQLRIDMGDTGAIEFFIDDNYVGSIAASALAVTHLLQPIVAVQKGAVAGTPSLTVDYVRVMWERF